jgi:hypothetical protein
LNAGGPPWAIAGRRVGPDPVEVLDELDTRLEAARSGDRPIDVQELERLYTTGCAHVLELEADSVRIARRVAELREQLRHVRTAIDWLHEQQAAGEPAQ